LARSTSETGIDDHLQVHVDVGGPGPLAWLPRTSVVLIVTSLGCVKTIVAPSGVPRTRETPRSIPWKTIYLILILCLLE